MTALDRPTPAVRRYARRGHRVQLVCFPHAGGSASAYRPWAALLPAEIELLCVQYPGHEDRISEPLRTSRRALAADVAVELAAVIDGPYALFGHSLGAAVAHDVAVILERRGHRAEALFVSGRPAPGCLPRTHLHRAPDDVLWDEVKRLGGTRSGVLEHEQLRPLLLPVVRADYRISETDDDERPRVSCPIVAVVGEEDDDAPVPLVAPWARATGASFDLEVLPGGHFYLQQRPDEVVRRVTSHVQVTIDTARARAEEQGVVEWWHASAAGSGDVVP